MSGDIIERATPPYHASIYSAEIQAIGLAVQLIRRRSETRFVIFSDSYSVLCKLRSNNYYHPVLRKVQHDLHELRLNGKTVSFCWVPGHIGIRGNERADIAAKLATVGQPEFILLHSAIGSCVLGRL